MHTILVCGVVLATTYSVWNGFTLTVRSWVRPEQVRAARATSSLGLFLVTAAAVTWFFRVDASWGEHRGVGGWGRVC